VTEPRLTTTATETETGTETEVSVEDAVAGEPVTVQREDGEPLAQSESTSLDRLTITSETDRDFSARVSTSETLAPDNPDRAVDLSPDRDGSRPVGYLTIDHDLDEEITEATISFSVRSERVGDGEVGLYRNVEGSWALPKRRGLVDSTRNPIRERDRRCRQLRGDHARLFGVRHRSRPRGQRYRDDRTHDDARDRCCWDDRLVDRNRR